MEATLVCVDNSEWTRNGDFAPTRFQAQADAVNLLAGAKTQANAENAVGVLTMAGKTPRVLVTPTPDLGKILNSMQDVTIEGDANLSSSVQIAQLALKHRQNKNQRQRVVIFIGSPIKEDKEKLVKIAKKLKKNNVAVDVVSFGSEEENAEKLEAFQEAVNSGDNSHLVTVPPGTVLSDMLFGSPIFQHGDGGGEGYGAGAGGAGGAVEGFEFGVDPSLDPELALALRVSLEEERARQNMAASAAAREAGGDTAGDAATAAAEDDSPRTPVAQLLPPTPDFLGPRPGAVAMDEDALLQQALAMSMQVDHDEGGQQAVGTADGAAEAADDTMDEDAELQMALQMSMSEAQSEAPGAGVSQMFSDPEYLSSVLGALPGVDPNDPALRSTLQSLGQPQGDGKDADSSKKDSSKKDEDKQ